MNKNINDENNEYYVNWHEVKSFLYFIFLLRENGNMFVIFSFLLREKGNTFNAFSFFT